MSGVWRGIDIFFFLEPVGPGDGTQEAKML
jgi:hypothetical protein